jgi:Holliday junction resolvasome RuvABC endonuclease subunit
VLYCDNLLDKKYNRLEYWNRTDVITNHIKEIIDCFKPATVMIENAFMSGRTASSNMPLLMLRGIVLNSLKDLGCTVKGVNPSSARAYLKIKPNDKETAFNYIKERFPEVGLESFKKDNDKSDAIIVALNKENEKNENII